MTLKARGQDVEGLNASRREGLESILGARGNCQRNNMLNLHFRKIPAGRGVNPASEVG